MSLDAPLQSSLWYRVAALKPRLLARARLHRHQYRGERWYLLRNPATGAVHRFDAAARVVLAAMDGRRSVDDLWQIARRRLGEDAPTQDEVLQLLGQLHAGDMLRSDAPPDVLELFERGRRQERAKHRKSWTNPMALRIPLWDPGQFLDRWAGCWRWLWGRGGALLWLAVVLPALVLVPAHWPELTGNLADRVLAADNLLLVALVFPVIKALHELGHATATRAGGGEVHDIGVMLLVLMPVPYVDASAATVFRSRWRRALVAAAGMLVELFIAACAFYVWLAVEPGLLRAVCFNVMLVAGVSTLVFNGNPLLRYDAYYILADLAELPNLAQRSTRQWGYLFDRHVLRVPDTRPPSSSRSERLWFTFYGLLATVYRTLVTLAIALFVGSQFFFIGVALALWAVAVMVGLPLVKFVQQLQSRPALRERRLRLLGVGAVLAIPVTLALLLLPVPQRRLAEGVVWLPEQAILRAGIGGFISSLHARPGERVQAGQLLLGRTDPALQAQLRTAQARVAELEASYGVAFVTDRARAEIVREQLQAEQAGLERAQQRAAMLPVTAQVDGVFTLPSPQDLTGRWHKKGEVLGHVQGAAPPIVRVVVEQAEADLIGASTRAVALRLADEPGRVIAGHIERQVPAGRDETPSRALVAAGGGHLATDARDPDGRKTLERVFQIDVALDEALGRSPAFGQRVTLRFELQPEPLAVQGWRALRRLFLRHFDV